MDVPLFIKAKSGWNDQKNRRPRGPCHPLPASSSSSSSSSPAPLTLLVGSKKSGLFPWNLIPGSMQRKYQTTNIDNQPGTTLVPKKKSSSR